MAHIDDYRQIQARYPPLIGDDTHYNRWAQHMRAGPPNPQPPHNSPTPQAVALAAALEAAAVALLNAVAVLRKPS